MPSPRLKAKPGRFRTRAPAAQFRVGDDVRVRFGNTLSKAKIIEDRGPIGINGRRLVRVQLVNSESNPELAFELPVDELVAA